MKSFFASKPFIVSSVAVIVSMVPLAAFAVTSISLTFPVSTGSPNSTSSIGGFVNNFYQFALVIGSLLAFAVVVYGGVRYMTSAGNPSQQSDAKEWIESALLGLLLLAGAYFILYTIDPNLVQLGLPPLSQVQLSTTGPGGTGTPGGQGGSPYQPGARCTPPPSGPCSTASLQGTCLGNNAALAGGVCNVESNGQNAAGGDLSTNVGPNGKRLPASVGLFQINLSANRIPANCTPGSSGCLDCPSAFSNPYTGHNPHTTIKNMTLYNQCLAAAENPQVNIQEACQLSKNGTTWSLWGPATKSSCGIN